MARKAAPNDLAVRLADVQVRPTRQRLLVLEALASEPSDTTAQDLHARLREHGERIGLATVYRTLSLLTERHVVDELSHQAGESCYRLCSPGHHHHLVCTSCHRVEELEDCAIDEWLSSASRSRGFSLTSHTLEVSGVCADCLAG
jgi:Fur family transcriptional regulator, ferric uptake regulator